MIFFSALTVHDVQDVKLLFEQLTNRNVAIKLFSHSVNYSSFVIATEVCKVS